MAELVPTKATDRDMFNIWQVFLFAVAPCLSNKMATTQNQPTCDQGWDHITG